VVVSAVESYSSDEASSSGGEASLRARGVMREVRPSNESGKGMKEAAGLGEANMSASIILRLTDGGVLSFRDEGPAEGDMFGPVAEAILFGEGNCSGAILIEGSG